MSLLLGLLAGGIKDCPSAASRKCHKSGKITLCYFYVKNCINFSTAFKKMI